LKPFPRGAKTALASFRWDKLFIVPQEDRFNRERLSHFVGFEPLKSDPKGWTDLREIITQHGWLEKFGAMKFPQDSFIFYSSLHDNLVKDVRIVERLGRKKLEPRLQWFSSHPASQGGMSSLGCLSTKADQAFQIVVEPGFGAHFSMMR